MIKKGGLIYCPKGEHVWEKDTFMTPHAMQLNENEIWIAGGVRDGLGVSRIKSINVKVNDPRKIISVAKSPILDIGEPGCFDDNGVILGDIIRVKNQLYMYYVGFQLVEKVKFLAFSGLAISSDNGKTVERFSQSPVLDRTDRGRYGRGIHTVLYDDEIFKCWYAIINDWKVINGIPYPVYDIWYTESKDGINFPHEDKVCCIKTIGNEYRIGRPKVYKTEFGYEMYYTKDTISKEYLVGYAISEDGIHWERKEDAINLKKSKEGWDSEMACYPVKLVTEGKTYLFYNGNGMGKTGVGYAEII